MSAALGSEQRKLFDEPNFGFLATVMPDGSPHVTAVWVDTEGDAILVNTATGRVKARNVRQDARVALAVIDRDNPYRQVIIRGEVEEVTEAGSDAHIDKLSAKYLGEPEYPWRQPEERRLKLRIRPHEVISQV